MGVILYDIKGEANNSVQEFEATRNRIVGGTEQMTEQCANNHCKCYILGLQLMHTFCERFRVNSESKFHCATTDPDDLSELKLTL